MNSSYEEKNKYFLFLGLGKRVLGDGEGGFLKVRGMGIGFFTTSQALSSFLQDTAFT